MKYYDDDKKMLKAIGEKREIMIRRKGFLYSTTKAIGMNKSMLHTELKDFD